MSLLLDAGALIGYERGNPIVIGALARATQDRTPVITSASVTAQVWRNESRQVPLERLLRAVDERPVNTESSPVIGTLLRLSETTDVVDGALVTLAADGDEVLTSDPADIHRLLTARGVRARITVV